MTEISRNAPIPRRAWLRWTASAGMAWLAGAAQAAESPSKPIRLVVPAPPGGGTDMMSRLLSNALNSTLGWTVVVDNVPGAGGNIGLDKAAKSPPDGYTLAMGESSNLTVNQALYKKMPFDVARDLTPVTLMAKVPLVLVVSAKGPYRSVADLAGAAKRKAVTFASSGNGTLAHLCGELWKGKAGLDLVHVPYRGAAPAMTDLASGQVDMFAASITAALPMIQAGLLRPLAVASPLRAAALPNVPTMAESGFQGIEAAVIFGVVAPTGTPDPVVSRLNLEINRALKQPRLRQSLIDQGAIPESLGGTVPGFASLLKDERAKWGQVVRDSGDSVD